jgi:hypothetical protein
MPRTQLISWMERMKMNLYVIMERIDYRAPTRMTIFCSSLLKMLHSYKLPIG